ncbi:MAG: RsmD family RNA methyltransferase [Acidilobaceae archaeon]
MEKLYLLYSLENQPLAREELGALIEIAVPESRILAEAEGLVLLEARVEDVRRAFSRSAYILEYGELLSYGSIDEVEQVVEEAVAKKGYSSPAIHAKSIKSYGREALSKLEKLSLKNSRRGYLRVVASESLVAAGVPLEKLKISRAIKPRARAVTGALDPRVSRALVNLSRLREGGVFLDPFCGTGNLAIEACSVGASRALCSDIDSSMCGVSRVNAEKAGVAECVEVLRSDAREQPHPGESLDAVATDPPYGRSSSTRGEGYERLVEEFLEESLDSLKRGSYIVYAGPYELKPWLLAERVGLVFVKRIHMFVHRSLVREVVVARVP